MSVWSRLPLLSIRSTNGDVSLVSNGLFLLVSVLQRVTKGHKVAILLPTYQCRVKGLTLSTRASVGLVFMKSNTVHRNELNVRRNSVCGICDYSFVYCYSRSPEIRSLLYL